MRSIKEMSGELSVLSNMLDKYARVSRMAFDFGLESPLYPAEVHMVSAVVSLGSSSVSALGENFGVTRGAASQMVGKLVKKGLLTKRLDPEKRSRWIVEPTRAGREVHERHMRFHMEHDSDFYEYLAALSPEEYETVGTLFRMMDRWMASYIDDQPDGKREKK